MKQSCTSPLIKERRRQFAIAHLERIVTEAGDKQSFANEAIRRGLYSPGSNYQDIWFSLLKYADAHLQWQLGEFEK